MTTTEKVVRTVITDSLEIGYLEEGPAAGVPVVLLHGWPSDVHDWDRVSRLLAQCGYRVIVPWLRGFGPTRFRDPGQLRSGQQAALGADLRDFIAALGLERPIVAGYDWGGRAACVVAALWPSMVRALLSINGYNIFTIGASAEPAPAAQEYRYWYQWYLNTPRGIRGLEKNRRDIVQTLWRLWSPNWAFDDATLDRTALSFENPDWVAVTVHSYRHRYGNAPGDPALEEAEAQLERRPPITVPTVVLHGACDGVTPPEPVARVNAHFTSYFQYRVIERAGHFLSREAPEAVVDAIRELS